MCLGPLSWFGRIYSLLKNSLVAFALIRDYGQDWEESLVSGETNGKGPKDSASQVIKPFSNNSHSRIIAVEGCIGVGKTTWAEALSKTRRAHLILEEFEKNPFLSAFYENPTDNALETELNFLLIHYHQLKNIQNQNETEIVTDFTLFKDTIFAALNLNVTDAQIFNQLYDHLDRRLRPIDVIVYLCGSDQLVMQRIQERNRTVELKIEMDYFIKLNRAYNEFFAQYRRGSLYVIDADSWDCVKEPELAAKVSRDIDGILATTISS
jgi:deoxyguanosine kinase